MPAAPKHLVSSTTQASLSRYTRDLFEKDYFCGHFPFPTHYRLLGVKISVYVRYSLFLFGFICVKKLFTSVSVIQAAFSKGLTFSQRRETDSYTAPLVSKIHGIYGKEGICKSVNRVEQLYIWQD